MLLSDLPTPISYRGLVFVIAESVFHVRLSLPCRFALTRPLLVQLPFDRALGFLPDGN